MLEVISWIVTSGKKLGRTIWFPTVNIPWKSNTLASWTYKIRAFLWKEYYSWVGVYFQDRDLFEAHLFDYSDDCYWEEIDIIPTVFLRENKKFDTLEQLQTAITQDCKKAKEIETTVVTFWTFDHFHKGHEYYLWKAKLYGDKLVTIIARDTTVKSVKSLTPTHTEKERMEAVSRSCIVDHAVLWDTNDYYTCLRERTPDVIYLWYDQHSFDSWIEIRYKQQELTIPHIVRGEAYREDEFKSSYFRK